LKDSKKKILVMTSGYKRWQDDEQYNEHFVVELTKRLSQKFNISVLAPSYPSSKAEETIDGIRIYRHKQYISPKVSIAYKNGMISNVRENNWLIRVIPFYILFQFINLMRIVKKENMQVIHAHWIIPQGLVAVLYKIICNRKIKIIATIHGSDFLSINNFIGKQLKKFIISRVDCLTVVSNAIKSEVERITSQENIFVCPMGIDTSMFKPTCKDLSLKQELDIHKEFLLFVGSCVEQKGIRYLVEAMTEICSGYPECKLVVIGSGSLLEEMKIIAKNAGLEKNICFLGYMEHIKLPKYFATADVFILPSLSEGYSLVVREALSSGTPTIVTDLPVFSTDKANGLFEIVPPKDSRSIAEKVKYILGHKEKYEKEKENMHEFAVDNFDWIKVADNYANLINSI
jgi:glycosyltransferase involved in cell wall biosynthesis